MALSREERAALPDSDFAVPAKRALPMHDAKHVSMAWREVSRTKDLTDEERETARHRILTKAKDLGVDTSDWSTIKAMAFDAMSLNVPLTEGHPNKMPFSGVLTRIDQPSDAAPHGSNGRRVILTHAAAEAALPGILGQAVDFTTSFNGHDAQRKIGVITDAEIDGDAITIAGFIYAADFPDAAARIRAMKDVLGFSYEMKNVLVADPGADTLVIESCEFTGAAILRKTDAAYHSTSLAASKDNATGDLEMTKEELEAVLAAALAPINAKIGEIEASQTAIKGDLEASKEAQSKVAPHADALRACSAAMQAAGIGGHPTAGHVVRINKMADHMEAAAAMGNIPHIYRDHDFFVDAAADKTVKTEIVADPAVAELKASVAVLTTKLADLGTKAFNAAAEPERKTVSGDVRQLLAKAGFDLDANAEKKVSVAEFDGFLDKSGIRGVQAMTLKLNARESGLLASA